MTPNPDILRRRNHQRLAHIWDLGWTQRTADTYAEAVQDLHPTDHEAACNDLLRTWKGRTMPPPAEIRDRAENHRRHRTRDAVRARETAAEHDRGIKRTEFDLDAPLCHRCGGGLMWLTDDDITYCPSCNSAQVQDPQTGRTKLTQADRDGLRVAAGPPGRHMRHPGEAA